MTTATSAPPFPPKMPSNPEGTVVLAVSPLLRERAIVSVRGDETLEDLIALHTAAVERAIRADPSLAVRITNLRLEPDGA